MDPEVKDALYEQISALADDELDPRERELLIRRLERDPQARERWSAYHRIGELMRGGAVVRAGLADRVAGALADEPAHGATMRVPEWVRPLAGMAIAASVTAVAILAVRQPAPSVDLSPVADTPMVQPALDAEVGVRAAAMRDDEQARLQQRMEAYLVNYAESAAATRPQGVLEFVHVTRQGDMSLPGADAAAEDAAQSAPEEGDDGTDDRD